MKALVRYIDRGVTDYQEANKIIFCSFLGLIVVLLIYMYSKWCVLEVYSVCYPLSDEIIPVQSHMKKPAEQRSFMWQLGYWRIWKTWRIIFREERTTAARVRRGIEAASSEDVRKLLVFGRLTILIGAQTVTQDGQTERTTDCGFYEFTHCSQRRSSRCQGSRSKGELGEFWRYRWEIIVP
ncbi:hypothetical protein [Klebsiella pneumoniae]|uniref:hypothetical protein n=1 Tax=Klebsiella pneumoniae TaxID=573 RepID=UPI0022B68F79|nr:hypothetical protein [Klebsiella pneumoniae]